MELEKICSLFFRNSLYLSPLILVLLFISAKRGKKYKANNLYYLWAILLVGLLVPFRMNVPVSGLLLEQAPKIETAVFSSKEMIFVTEKNGITMEQTVQTEQESQSGAVTEETAVAGAMVNVPPVPWKKVLAVFWAGGMILFLSASVHQQMRLMKRVNRWSTPVTNKEILSTYQEAAAGIGSTVLPPLYSCKFLSTPMGAGLFHTKIYLPDLEYRPEELRLLLCHELVHCKRRDLWYKLLILTANAVHWYNPLLYWMRSEIGKLCEISCDEAVLQSREEICPKSYSLMILNAMEKGNQSRALLSTQFGGSKKEVLRRLSAIMERRQKKGCALMMSALILCTFSSGIVVSAEEPELSYIQPDNTITQSMTGAAGEREFYYRITKDVGKDYALQKGLVQVTLPCNPETPEALAKIRSSLEQEISGAVFLFENGSRTAYELNVPGANELSSGFIASINSASQNRMAYFGSLVRVDGTPEQDEKYWGQLNQETAYQSVQFSSYEQPIDETTDTVAEAEAGSAMNSPVIQSAAPQTILVQTGAESAAQLGSIDSDAAVAVTLSDNLDGIGITRGFLWDTEDVVYLDCLPNTVEADRARREYFSDEYNASAEFVFADGSHLRYTLETSVCGGKWTSLGSEKMNQEAAEQNGYNFVLVNALPETQQAKQIENAYLSQRKPVLFQYRNGAYQVGRMIQSKGTTLLIQQGK